MDVGLTASMKGNPVGVGIDAEEKIANSATSTRTIIAGRIPTTHKGQTKATTSAKRLAKKKISRIKGRICAQTTAKIHCASILARETAAQRETNAHFSTQLIATSETINAPKKETATTTESCQMTRTTKKTANPKIKLTIEAHQAKTDIKNLRHCKKCEEIVAFPDV